MAKLGDRIDKFTLVRQLGAGGMGATWEAVRQSGHDFEQRVAIKLADADVLETTDGLESFRREAALAASLRHPNIAAVLDVDERGGYIVCELVDGADLRAVLKAAPGGRLDATVVVHLLGQIARGLSHAHRRILRGRSSPVIHRDMSPGNVVIDYDGNVKIVDFGIARAIVGGGADVPESIKGKLSYMAPEQAMGGRMDGRVDQYAVGVIAYEALTGVRPNDGAHEGETLASVLGGKHVPIGQRLPSLSPGLASIIERMLALRPEQRFSSFDSVLDALSAYTPPLTTHRSLVPLVIAARQPHTIVRENGRFISRPVEAEPMLRAMSTPTPPPLRRLPGSSTPPALPNGGAGGLAAVRDTPARASGGRGVLLAATLGATESSQPSPSARIVSPADRPQRAPVRVVHEATPTPVTPLSTPMPVRQRRSSSSAKRSWIDRVLASRVFWQGLTGLGAALLVFVAWAAFSPEALLLLAADPIQPNTPTAQLTGRAALGSSSVAALTSTRQPLANEASDAPDPDADDGIQASARVRVVPSGQVWIDQELIGVASPTLELSVRPGVHVISVGRDHPTQSQTVDLRPGAQQQLAFDLDAN